MWTDGEDGWRPPAIMNGGRLMTDTFGGSCKAFGTECRFQPNGGRHTCRDSEAFRWQCAASRLARAVVDTAMMENRPEKISPDHITNEIIQRLVPVVIQEFKRTRRDYDRLPAAIRHAPSRSIKLECLHAIKTYNKFRVLDYLRDVVLSPSKHRPHPNDAAIQEMEEAYRARDVQRFVWAVEGAMPEADRRLLRVRLSEWAEYVSRKPLPPGAAALDLVQVILDEGAKARRAEERMRRGRAVAEPPAPPPPPPPRSDLDRRSFERLPADALPPSPAASSEEGPASPSSSSSAAASASASSVTAEEEEVDEDDDDESPLSSPSGPRTPEAEASDADDMSVSSEEEPIEKRVTRSTSRVVAEADAFRSPSAPRKVRFQDLPPYEDEGDDPERKPKRTARENTQKNTR